MSNTVRAILGLVLVAALAAMGTPQLSEKLPEGLSTVLAVAFAAMLREMDKKAPAPKEDA